MRIIGDALKEYKQMSMCIGIASWDPLDGKESLEAGIDGDFKLGSVQRSSTPKGTIDNPFVYTGTKLDKNHSHYILVDAGEGSSYGAEIEVRHELEDFVSFRRDTTGYKVSRLANEIAEQHSDSKRSIPVICVCFGGGPGSITTLQAAMNSGRPIILVKGSMRITDCVVGMVELKQKMLNQDVDSDAKRSVASSPSPRRATTETLRGQQIRVIDHHMRLSNDKLNDEQKAGKKNRLPSLARLHFGRVALVVKVVKFLLLWFYSFVVSLKVKPWCLLLQALLKFLSIPSCMSLMFSRGKFIRKTRTVLTTPCCLYCSVRSSSQQRSSKGTSCR